MSAHRLKSKQPPTAPADRLFDELESLQEAAGMAPSEPHPYLRCIAELKFMEQHAVSVQRRVAQLRRTLAGIPDPAMRIRIFHLRSADAALETVALSGQWAGIYATDDGAVLVLGSSRE